ncbi:MAG: hypothetical protein IKY99_09335 [Bacteroidaceae bacterium]|nr:hypothetical protein [Bacteroidaceae bacterium]
MEGMNYLTSGDLAMWEVRNRNYGYPCDGYGHHQKNGIAATGLGLGAGLGGAALIAALVVGWGVNQASKARARAAENSVNLVNSNLNQLANLQLAETQNRYAMVNAERVSRETWQNYHAPSTTQYVDVRTGAGAFAGAGSNAWSQAEANLVSGALTGQYARCPQEVTLVSKQNCGCPATNCGCGGGFNG